MTVPAESERDGDQVVEWWTPEVGARVRVKLSPECSWFSDQAFTDHTGAVDGAVGTVWMIAHAGTFHDDHRFFVNFDQPWPEMVFFGERKPGHGGSYAANELEPAGPPPPGDDAG